MQLCEADDHGQTVPEAHHNGLGNECDESFSADEPHTAHEHTCDHHGRKEELHALAALPRHLGLRDEGADDRRKSSRRPIDHSWSSAKDAADESYYPRAVHRDWRCHIGQKRESHRFWHLGKADCDAQEHLRLHIVHLLRRTHLVPLFRVARSLIVIVLKPTGHLDSHGCGSFPFTHAFRAVGAEICLRQCSDSSSLWTEAAVPIRL
mmetsp:Transcript_30308/g.81472  ORF Transcript_30308/g.81472 Transcript_30308/m.81472 type:complete len:207 (+) Transcript_30308:1343-1963(+)